MVDNQDDADAERMKLARPKKKLPQLKQKDFRTSNNGRSWIRRRTGTGTGTEETDEEESYGLHRSVLCVFETFSYHFFPCFFLPFLDFFVTFAFATVVVFFLALALVVEVLVVVVVV